MANMRHVNQYIKTNFPTLKIEAVRGDGYVYFDGEDGFDKVESIMVHTPSVSTDDLVCMVMEQIQDAYLGEDV
jgi:hypothetical protein